MRAKTILGIVCLIAAATVVTQPAHAGPFHLSFGVTIGNALPAEAVRVRIDRERFFHYHGSFYRQVAQGFMLVSAPVGAQVRELPRGAMAFTHEGVAYFHHAGACYKALRRGFEVCEIPAGARAEIRRTELTAKYQLTVHQDGESFLFRSGVFFRASPEGLHVQTTPVGAVAKDFPPDAMSVWFQGHEYFEANGVFFREVPGGFVVTSAPWPNALEIAANR